VTGTEVTQRLDELKADVELNKDKLFVIICDEAHSGCTKSTKTQNESPYYKIVNFWNSDDHPNVFVILVSGEQNVFSIYLKDRFERVYLDATSGFSG
jgi:hypothetical protein